MEELITWIISLISLICLIIILIVTYRKKLHLSFSNTFVLQLLFSEMLNNITQLTSFFMKFISKIENYYLFTSLCYLQIATNTFSNLLTLISSCQILISIYLTIRGKLSSKNPLSLKLFSVLPLQFAFIVSYIFWIIQMQKFQHLKRIRKLYTRIISCSLDPILDIGIYIIFAVLFCISIYFLYKIWKFLEFIKSNIMRDNEAQGAEKLSPTYKTAKKLQDTLLFYPLVVFFIYIVQIIGSILYYVTPKQRTFSQVIFVLISMNLRGFLFIICCLITQQKFRDGICELITCQKDDSVYSSSILDENNERPLGDKSELDNEEF